MRDLFRRDRRGQAEMVNVAITLIISLVVGIIVLNQLFLSGAGPTDNVEDPRYDEDALTSYNNIRSLAWAGIALMAISIIVLAAVTIMGIVRGGLGGRNGV